MDCNHQAFWAGELLLQICREVGEMDDYMLQKLVLNLKLLTLAYQHIKGTESKKLFMDWWNRHYHSNWWDYEKID